MAAWGIGRILFAAVLSSGAWAQVASRSRTSRLLFHLHSHDCNACHTPDPRQMSLTGWLMYKRGQKVNQPRRELAHIFTNRQCVTPNKMLALALLAPLDPASLPLPWKSGILFVCVLMVIYFKKKISLGRKMPVLIKSEVVINTCHRSCCWWRLVGGVALGASGHTCLCTACPASYFTDDRIWLCISSC